MTQRKLFEQPEKPILAEIPLQTALEVGEQVRFLVSEHMLNAEVVGSARRKKPICHDIDIVGIATPENFEKAVANIKKEFLVTYKENGKKVKKLYIESNGHRVQVDLYATTPDTFGLTKIIRTGSAEHNIWLSNYARKNGFRIKYSEGLVKAEKVVAGKTEESVFSALGLQVPEPEKREMIDGQPLWQH
jgi:DNA polymerase (family 10)